MALEDIRVHVRFKLFALWSSAMFFYIYGDYFQLYQPGMLQQMLIGRMPLGAISQHVLLGMSCVMVLPNLMPFLTLVLPARTNRWFNIVVGAIYSVIMLLIAVSSTWYYYIAYALIEAVLTLTVVFYAWTWPKQEGS